MADRRRRRPENVEGDFYVDATCIDCDTCRWVAPGVFDRKGSMSRVHQQPVDSAQRLRAHMAVLACPTASIGSESGLDLLTEAQAGFPEPVAGPVLHCGWHSKDSFGAGSYLIQREQGNVMVDSPRFARPLVERLEALGGVHTIFLTHKDDVADHDKFARHFGARRVMHVADMGPDTRDVEVLIDSDDELCLAEDLTIIPTPGHTEGSLCLLLQGGYLFSGDHVAWSEPQGRLVAFERYCQHDWEVQRASMERLLGHTIRWILPGHGRRLHRTPAEMRAALVACAEWMGTVHAA